MNFVCELDQHVHNNNKNQKEPTYDVKRGYLSELQFFKPQKKPRNVGLREPSDEQYDESRTLFPLLQSD